MLNIPEQVKALFSADVIHKNFHVHFPNGEYRDLNNEDIISESVSFTESLCSQQYFKFGLAEASQIEFTAVGIPNIRGAYIECAIEIDCTRLGTEWAANNPIDNTLDFLTPQTCNYDNKLYYRVPYGRFKVDTCPRDHGAMFQRQVTGFTEQIKEDITNGFEIEKLNTLIPFDNVYTPGLENLIYSLMNRTSAIEAAGWEKTPLSISETRYPIQQSKTIYFIGYDDGKTIRSSVEAYRYELPHFDKQTMTSFKPNYLLLIDANRNYASERAELESYILDIPNVDWPRTLTANNVTTTKDFFDSLIGDMLFPFIRYDYYNKSGSEAYGNLLNVAIKTNGDLIYPYLGNKSIGYLATQLYYPIFTKSISYYDQDDHWVYESFTTPGSHSIYVYEKSTTTVLSNINLSINSTLKQNLYFNLIGKTVPVYSFANSYSPIKTMTGFLELQGAFFKPTRFGTLDYFLMSENPTAIPIPRSDWSEFWWDETPIDAIGQVKTIYANDSGDEQQETFTIGSGNSVYTMEDNEVLANSDMDTTTIQSILETYFAPNASVVNFTPVDLEMRGLPYLESGDYIQLTAEDGTEVETYILSQTINGIQHLTATVTSTNGELLEVIEDE